MLVARQSTLVVRGDCLLMFMEDTNRQVNHITSKENSIDNMLELIVLKCKYGIMKNACLSVE